MRPGRRSTPALRCGKSTVRAAARLRYGCVWHGVPGWIRRSPRAAQSMRDAAPAYAECSTMRTGAHRGRPACCRSRRLCRALRSCTSAPGACPAPVPQRGGLCGGIWVEATTVSLPFSIVCKAAVVLDVAVLVRWACSYQPSTLIRPGSLMASA